MLQKIELQAVTVGGKRKYVTPNGHYPSITTVLSSQENKKLDDWRKSLGPALADKKQQHAADRGTSLHKMCEDYLIDNVLPPINHPTHKLFNQIKPHLNKLSDHLLIEGCLYSDAMKIAGRVDYIGHYKNTLTVVDFKSSTGLKRKADILNYFLQATAYSLMCYEQYQLKIPNITIIIASENGLVPSVFQETIKPYVAPLYDVVEKFHSKNPLSNE
jgi:ATP-dependent exoDNAse (exonuclease V) beta subunit